MILVILLLPHGILKYKCFIYPFNFVVNWTQYKSYAYGQLHKLRDQIGDTFLYMKYKSKFWLILFCSTLVVYNDRSKWQNDAKNGKLFAVLKGPRNHQFALGLV